MAKKKKKRKTMKQMVAFTIPECDEEKVREGVERAVSETKKYTRAIRAAIWCIGNIILNETKDYTKRELSLFYALFAEQTGLTRAYLRQCKFIATRLPNLPDLMKKYDIPTSFFLWLARQGISVITIQRKIAESYESIKNFTFLDLCNWARDEFDLKGSFMPSLSCVFCEQDPENPQSPLHYSNRGKSWEYYPVHHHCMEYIKNDLIEDNIKKDEEILALKRIVTQLHSTKFPKKKEGN